MPFSILTSMSFNSIILMISAFSCLSMLSTEIRVRYLLLYSGLSSLFLLNVFAKNYFFIVGLIVVIISSFSIVLCSRKSKVEKLLEEVKSTSFLKSILLINCVLTIVAIILGHIQSFNIDAFYTPALFSVMMCYVLVSKVKRV